MSGQRTRTLSAFLRRRGASDGFCGPPLDLLQQACVFLVWRSPELTVTCSEAACRAENVEETRANKVILMMQMLAKPWQRPLNETEKNALVREVARRRTGMGLAEPCWEPGSEQVLSGGGFPLSERLVPALLRQEAPSGWIFGFLFVCLFFSKKCLCFLWNK